MQRRTVIQIIGLIVFACIAVGTTIYLVSDFTDERRDREHCADLDPFAQLVDDRCSDGT